MKEKPKAPRVKNYYTVEIQGRTFHSHSLRQWGDRGLIIDTAAESVRVVGSHTPAIVPAGLVVVTELPGMVLVPTNGNAEILATIQQQVDERFEEQQRQQLSQALSAPLKLQM